MTQQVYLSDALERLRVNPDDAAAMHAVGVAYVTRKEMSSAIAYLDRAVSLAPSEAEYHATLADALETAGEIARAEQMWRTACALAPNEGSLKFRLGRWYLDYQQQPDNAAAAEAFIDAIRVSPERFESYLGLAWVHIQGHTGEEAARAMLARLGPDVMALDVVRAVACAFSDFGRHAECAEMCSAIMRAAPRDVMTLMVRAESYAVLRDQEAALRDYELAVQIDPSGHVLHRYVRHLLRLERYDEAQLLYRHLAGRFRSADEWDGTPCSGKTVLMDNKWGHGDMLQFSRFAQQVQARGGRVAVLCQASLAPLIRSVPGVGYTGALCERVAYDYRIQPPEAGLFLVCHPSEVGKAVPYIAAPAGAVATWAARLRDGRDTLRVGLNWEGSGQLRRNPCRANLMSLEELAPIAAVPGVTCYSLQVGRAATPLTDGTAPFPIVDLGTSFRDFTDTAGAVKSLDVVISVDTSVAHLAGALGVPCYLAVPYYSCWRWGSHPTRTVWYPSMTLFRQSSPGDWTDVVRAMASSLAALVRVPAAS